MIAHLYTVLLAGRKAPQKDRFDYRQVLALPQYGVAVGMVRMAAHMAMVRRARLAARRR